MAKKILEWWGIDEEGYKYHEYIKTKYTNKKKIRKLIESEFGFNIETAQDFGFRLDYNANNY